MADPSTANSASSPEPIRGWVFQVGDRKARFRATETEMKRLVELFNEVIAQVSFANGTVIEDTEESDPVIHVDNSPK